MITFYNHQHKQTSKKEKEKRKNPSGMRGLKVPYSVLRNDADPDPLTLMRIRILASK